MPTLVTGGFWGTIHGRGLTALRLRQIHLAQECVVGRVARNAPEEWVPLDDAEVRPSLKVYPSPV